MARGRCSEKPWLKPAFTAEKEGRKIFTGSCSAKKMLTPNDANSRGGKGTRQGVVSCLSMDLFTGARGKTRVNMRPTETDGGVGNQRTRKRLGKKGVPKVKAEL